MTLIYQDWSIRFVKKGIYRIDADSPRLSVQQGEAEVFAGDSGVPVLVEQGMSLPFESGVAPEAAAQSTGDQLSDWSKGRGQSISADNAITAQIDEDPAAVTAGADAFTYFPFLGVSPINPVSPGPYGAPAPYGQPGLYASPGVYSSYALYQPGFNSIYLPGYTYAPLMLGLIGNGSRIGSGPRIYVPSALRPSMGAPRPGVIVTAPRTMGPILSAPRPAAPVRVAPRVGVGGGVHR